VEAEGRLGLLLRCGDCWSMVGSAGRHDVGGRPRTITAGRMTLCGSCVLLLLSGVGGCRFALTAHQYNASTAVASPDGRALHVAAWCAGSGAACTTVLDRMVCTGVRAAGMRLGLGWWYVAADVYDASWRFCFAVLAGVWSNGGNTVWCDYWCRVGG